MLCYFPSPITLSCSDSPVFIWFKSQISSCPHPTAGSVKSDAKSVGSHKSTKSMSSQKSTKSTKSLSSQKSEFCYHCAVWLLILEMVWMFAMSCRYLTIDVTNLGWKFSLNRLPFRIAMNNSVTLIAHSRAFHLDDRPFFTLSPLHHRWILKTGGRQYLEEFATSTTDTDNCTCSTAYSPNITILLVVILRLFTNLNSSSLNAELL